MSLMPTINDSMVVQLRRTGKRRASFRPGWSSGARVLLQRSRGCQAPGDPCITNRGEVGICDRTASGALICMVDPFPGPNPFEF